MKKGTEGQGHPRFVYEMNDEDCIKSMQEAKSNPIIVNPDDIVENGSDSRIIRVFLISADNEFVTLRQELYSEGYSKIAQACLERGATIEWTDYVEGAAQIESEARTDESDSPKQLNATSDSLAGLPFLDYCFRDREPAHEIVVGFFGTCYGRISPTFPQEILNHNAWLNDYIRRSNFEIELQYRLLNNPVKNFQALLYEKVCDETFDEEQNADEPGFLAKRREEKLSDLKNRIKNAGYTLTQPEGTRKDILKRIISDILDRIAQLPIKRDHYGDHFLAALHRNYSASRRWIYIRREELYRQLNIHAMSETPPLVILGEPGSGKTALLANWAESFRKENPDIPVIEHYLGSAPDQSNSHAIMRRLVSEIRHAAGTFEEDPRRLKRLSERFAEWLHIAAASGKTIMILDELEHLGEELEPFLNNLLKAHIPSAIRFIFSFRTERFHLNVPGSHEWLTIRVEPLDRSEKDLLVAEYAKKTGIPLDESQQARISALAPSNNPAYLLMLLRSLEISCRYRSTGQLLNRLLHMDSPEELVESTLQFLSESAPYAGIISPANVIRLISRSRRGLSENEISELFTDSASERKIPGNVMEAVFNDLRRLCIQSDGRLLLSHPFIITSLNNLKVISEIECDEMLTNYFSRLPASYRKLEQSGWLLERLDLKDNLRAMLTDLETLPVHYRADPGEICRLWEILETRTSHRLSESYDVVLNEPEKHPALAIPLSRLFNDWNATKKSLLLQRFQFSRTDSSLATGDVVHFLTEFANNLYQEGEFDEAYELFALLEKRFDAMDAISQKAWAQLYLALINHSKCRYDESNRLFKSSQNLYRNSGNLFGLEFCIGRWAVVLYSLGNFHSAIGLFNQQERICRSIGRLIGLSEALLGQALILRSWGDLDGAMALLKESERICRLLPYPRGLIDSLNNQAAIVRTRGDLNAAMLLFEEVGKICTRVEEPGGLQVALGGQASILRSRGELNRAEKLFSEQESICRVIGSKEGMQVALSGRAVILRDRGELQKAFTLSREAEKICREMDYKEGLQRILINQAMICRDLGDLDSALAVLRESERICRDLSLKAGLQRTLENLALVLKSRGDLDGALALLREQEKICREMGIKIGLQVALGHQADILHFRGEVGTAMSLFQEQERICRQLGLKDRLQYSLAGQAVIYRARGEWKRSMELLKEQEKICTELGLKGGLQISYYNQGIVHLIRGDMDGAMMLFKKQEEICRQTGYKEGMQASLGSQAVIHRNRGDLVTSMNLFCRQEEICRSCGYKEGLQVSLCGQSAIHQSRNELNQAMSKLQEGERICRELNHREGLQRILCAKSLIHKTRGELDKAMTMLQEAERICRVLDYKSGLQRALEYQAEVLTAQGKYQQSLILLKEQESICREVGIKAGLQAALGRQATIFKKKNELGKALQLLKEQESICRELGLKEPLARAMAHQAEILAEKLDRVKEAVSLVNEAWRLARNHGLDSISDQIQKVLRSINAQAGEGKNEPSNLAQWKDFQLRLAEKVVLMKERGDLPGALEKLRKHEKVCRELQMEEEVASCLSAQAQILRELDECQQALSLLQAEERIWRKRKNMPMLAESLTNQALLLVLDLDRPKEALAMAEEAYKIAESHGLSDLSHEVLKKLLELVNQTMDS